MTDRVSPEEGVAVIGIGCRFPGGVADAAGFWQLLHDGRDAIGAIPSDRIDVDHYFDARPGTPGRMMTRWGGFIDDVEGFDAEFFGVSPREAERIDPQQRWLLETAWEALEDAGQDVDGLTGRPVGVFVGQWLSDFESRLFADPSAMEFDMTTGSGRYAASGRVSYAFGLRGPSLTLDTGCSSSLVAVHLAARSVRSGESAMALAGGVNAILQPHISIAYSQSRMMAADGRCKFGDASGDGYVRSEGAALVLLKRLDRALTDGDRIYAVIRGSATNNDGRSSGSMGTPSRLGQEELLRSALQDAGVAGGDIGYVEAHGTGTRAGDPVEIGALAAVLGETRAAGPRCLIGSVKTNIGHTEGAAGVAGLIKAALALHHAEIPPTLHVREPTPAVPWADVPLALALGRTPWPRGVNPRLAGVNSFGIAGTNAHVVLEEAPASSTATPVDRSCAMLPLAARSVAALAALAARHAEALEADPDAGLSDWCAAAARRTAHDLRACFVAPDRPTLIEALRQFDGTGTAPIRTARPRVAFVVPGQGAQSIGMARELMRTEPVFLAAIRECDEAARPDLDVSIEAQLGADTAASDGSSDRIDVLQPVLVSLAIAYAALLRSWGVEPDMVVGHSMGEVGAACIAGALDVRQAMRIVCRRSKLMLRASGQGAMALVELSSQALAGRLEGRNGRVTVAVVNSPRSCVVSGVPEAVQRLMDDLERDGVFCRRVNVDVASHSAQMDPLADALRRDLAGLAPGPSTFPLYSSVLARRVEGSELGPAYWASNLREPVRFGAALEAMLGDGAGCFVELGPHSVLLPAVEQNVREGGPPIVTAVCGRRGVPDRQAILLAVGALWTAGVPVDWRRILPGDGRSAGLPAYPWQRRRHWAVAAERPVSDGTASGARRLPRPDPETLETLHRLEWVRRPSGTGPAATGPQRWLVAADDAAAARALCDALTNTGALASIVPVDAWPASLAERGADHAVLIAGTGPRSAYLPVEAARSLLNARLPQPPKLWLVTRGGQAVSAGERVDVDQAAAWGASRVVGAEHPELRGGSIDLPPPGVPFDGWDLAGRHLTSFDGEDQVALRDGGRFVLRLRPSAERLTAPLVLRPDASYLITGGLGGVGVHLARSMIAAGARRLVLLGRTALPPRETWAGLEAGSPSARRAAAVRELEALGAAIHPEAVDVGDETALRNWLARHEREGWPRIRGVVHAAGVFDNRLVIDMDRRSFDAAASAKLGGARLLDHLLPELDFFVLMSSTGAFLPQAGQANYAAANAGLDALAHDRRARGLPALSVGWGVWAGTGLVDDDAGRRNVAEMKREGIGALSPDVARGLFPWLCALPQAHVAVLPIDWTFHAAARWGRLPPLFEAFADAAGSLATRTGPEPDAAQGAAAATPAARGAALRAAVRDAVGKVLKMPASRIDPDKAFGAMGLNSLMAMELRNRLEAVLRRPLSATLAWNYPTVAALAEHLAAFEASTASEPPAAQLLTAPSSAALERVEELSDAEAAMALRGRGRRGAT